MLRYMSIRAQVRHKRVQIVVFSTKWQGDTKFFQHGITTGETGNDIIPRRCFYPKQVATNGGDNQDLNPNGKTIVVVVVGNNALENPFTGAV